MNRRTTITGLLLAALVAVLTLAAACGSDDGGTTTTGGDELTLQQYMERLEQLSIEYNNRTDALETQYDEDLTGIETDEEGILISNEFLRTGGNAITTFINGIERLAPPDEAQALHDAAVTAGRAMATGIDELVDTLDETTTRADYEAEFQSSGVSELGDTFEQSCFDMQDFADTNNIVVSFDCDE